MKKTLGEMELKRKTLPIRETMFVKWAEGGSSYKSLLGEVDCEYPSILRLSGEGETINHGTMLNPFGYESFKKITDRLGILLDGNIPNNKNDYLCSWERGRQINFKDEINGGYGYLGTRPHFPNKGRNFPKWPEYRTNFFGDEIKKFEEPGFLFNDIQEIWGKFENNGDSKLIDKIKYRIKDMKEVWTESHWYRGTMVSYDNLNEKKVFKFFEGMLNNNLPGLEEKRMIGNLEKDGFQKEIILETLKEPVFSLSANQIKKNFIRSKKDIKYEVPSGFGLF